MPAQADSSCPFCGARIGNGHSACPACDLPLLGADGEHPPPRTRAPYDGATELEFALPDDEFVREHLSRPRLATERQIKQLGRLRCAVVAINRAEAEMLCDMLRAEGVPCMIRTPDGHAYASTSLRCQVLVPETSLDDARQLLRIESAAPSTESSGHFFTAALVLAIVAAALAMALLIAFAS